MKNDDVEIGNIIKCTYLTTTIFYFVIAKRPSRSSTYKYDIKTFLLGPSSYRIKWMNSMFETAWTDQTEKIIL